MNKIKIKMQKSNIKNKDGALPHTPINKIIKIINENKKFLIAAHENLDGDSFGSGLALGLALRRMGKDVKFIIINTIPKRYIFLPGIKELICYSCRNLNLKKYEVLIVLDTAGRDQLPNLNPALFRQHIIINIDHHVDNGLFGSVNWIDTKVSAVGEQIYCLLKALRVNITKNIAECLYTAILTDTGNFQFTNTTAETHKITADLIQKGVRPSFVSEQIYEKLNINRLKLLKYALITLKTKHNNKIAWLWITQRALKKAKAKREDAEGFIDYLKAIDGVKVAIIFKEEINRDEIRVNFRSKDAKFRVNNIAHKFGGGGHPAAAGCTVFGTHKEAEKKVLKAVEEVL